MSNNSLVQATPMQNALAGSLLIGTATGGALLLIHAIANKLKDIDLNFSAFDKINFNLKANSKSTT